MGCAKENEFTNSAVTPAPKAELSTTNSFKIGEVNSAGVLTITYDLIELGELCACAVSESSAASLALLDKPGVGYYLVGIGSSSSSSTSFGVELSTLGSDLMWDEGAHIAQCKSNNSIPCSLDIIGSETFDCNQQPGSTTCASQETGGTNGGVYPDCEFTNWPWVGKDMDEEEEEDKD